MATIYSGNFLNTRRTASPPPPRTLPRPPPALAAPRLPLPPQVLPASLPTQDVQTVFPLQMDVKSGDILVNVTNGSAVPARVYSAHTLDSLKKEVVSSSTIQSRYMLSQGARSYAQGELAKQGAIYGAKEATAAAAAAQRKQTLDAAKVPYLLRPFSGNRVPYPTMKNFNPVVDAYQMDSAAEKFSTQADINRRRDMCGWKKNMLGFWYRARPRPINNPEFDVRVCSEFEKKRGGKLTRRLTNKMKMTRKRK